MTDDMDDETRKKMMTHYFFDYIEVLNRREQRAEPPEEGGKYKCPCCGYKTLEERGGYDICPVCFWEDDGQDDADADLYHPFSPNHMSLTQGRENYRRLGASDERMLENVRPPLPEEL